MRMHLVLSLNVLLAAAAIDGAELWVTDFAAAKKTAAAENKDLLVLFTGSDWCSWCKKLEREVFAKQEFQNQAPAEFVLVMLDFPRRRQVPADVKQARNALKQKYKIRGFPTVALMNAEGEVYARTGYQAGGPKKYLDHLADLKAKKGSDQKLLEQANAATGIQKAKLLDQWVKRRGELRLAVDHAKVYPQIIELDPQNKAGLKKTYETELFMLELNAKLTALGRARKRDEMLALIDKTLTDRQDLPAAARQALHYRKASALLWAKQFDACEKAIVEGEKLGTDGRYGNAFKNLRKYLGLMRQRAAGRK